MVEVYFYMPAKQADDVVGCGIKLSEWYNREVEIDGERKKCISTLLNPRDDYGKYMSADYKCLKLEVLPKYCHVADRVLYQSGLAFPEVMDKYVRSIIPVEKYTFGRYRLPECLVTSTVIGDYVSLLDKRLDSPILFNNSGELYINNIIEGFKEENDDFNDVLLYFYFDNMVRIGKMRKVEDPASSMAVFTLETDGRIYTVKIPGLGNNRTV